MGKAVPVIAATIIAVGVALGVSLAGQTGSAGKAVVPITSQLELDTFVRLAEKSCRCERNSGSKETCWQDYKDRTSGRVASSAASACEPISTEIDCFEVGGKESCIVTGRNGSDLCTEDEARAAEFAYYQALKASERRFPGDYQRAGLAANAAFAGVVRQIRRGHVPKVSGPTEGCS